MYYNCNGTYNVLYTMKINTFQIQSQKLPHNALILWTKSVVWRRLMVRTTDSVNPKHIFSLSQPFWATLVHLCCFCIMHSPTSYPVKLSLPRGIVKNLIPLDTPEYVLDIHVQYVLFIIRRRLIFSLLVFSSSKSEFQLPMKSEETGHECIIWF